MSTYLTTDSERVDELWEEWMDRFDVSHDTLNDINALVHWKSDRG